MGCGLTSRIPTGRLGGLWHFGLAVVLLLLSAPPGLAESVIAGETGREVSDRVMASHLETAVRDTAVVGRETAPSKVRDLTATAIDTSRISLEWRPPADTGSSAVAAYQIEESENGTDWNIIAAVFPPDTTYTRDGRTPNTTYYYRVSAVNGSGAGDASDVASATTEATGVPGAPTGLTATADGQSAIDLSWTAPADTGTSAITGYRIDRLSDDFLSWIVLAANTNSTATTYKDAGLDPGTFRIYRVAAINATGAGPESDVADATTEEAGAPGAPANLTATPDGQTAIDLAWDEPSDTGTSAITGYLIEVSEDETTWSDLVEDTESTATTYEHSGLQAGDTRYYRVSAINGSGAGDPSGAASATTESPPGKPTGLTATADGQTAIDLAWDEPSDTGSSAITGYLIEVSEDGTTWSDLVEDTESTATTYEHSGLQAGDTRHYRVSAINGSGTGDPSDVANATTESPPGKPTNLAATVDGPSQISLLWRSPADTGSSAIVAYQIEESGDGSSWNVITTVIAPDTTYARTGLTPNTTYHYRVSAVNSAGVGDPSDAASATTEATGAPGAPTGLTATADGQSAIDLAWTAPADTGTSAITGYRIDRLSDDFLSWIVLAANTGTTATTYEDTGLDPGTFRIYSVAAINGTGAGPESDPADATTEEAGAPGAAYQPHRDGGRPDGHRPVVDRAGGHRYQRHHRLPDRGVGRRLGLVQPRGRHGVDRDHLRAFGAPGRRHPPLPGLGDQRQRNGRPIGRRQRHDRESTRQTHQPGRDGGRPVSNQPLVAVAGGYGELGHSGLSDRRVGGRFRLERHHHCDRTGYHLRPVGAHTQYHLPLQGFGRQQRRRG